MKGEEQIRIQPGQAFRFNTRKKAGWPQRATFLIREHDGQEIPAGVLEYRGPHEEEEGLYVDWNNVSGYDQTMILTIQHDHDGWKNSNTRFRNGNTSLKVIESNDGGAGNWDNLIVFW